MRYDEQAFIMSYDAYNKTELTKSKDDAIKNKQDKVLKLLLGKFEEQLKSKQELEEGILKIEFKSIFYSDFNDGYREIDELVKSNNFDDFAREYCMYLGEVEHRCDEYNDAYYEVIWDYKTYFEQLRENKNNVLLPYPVGSYVTTEEDGILHIDQVHQYVYDRNGLGVILELEVLSNPRLSVRIDMKDFLLNWNIYDAPKNASKKRRKEL